MSAKNKAANPSAPRAKAVPDIEIVAPFRDRATGELVEVGGNLPQGLTAEAIERLVQAKCLRRLPKA